MNAKTFFSLLALAFLLFLLGSMTGCASYTHERPIFTSSAVVGVERSSMSKETPAGKNVLHESSSSERPVYGQSQALAGYERTTFRSFFMMGTAGKIHSLTKDANGYSRSLSVGALQMQGDSEALKASAEAIGIAAGTAAAEAAKKLVGKP